MSFWEKAFYSALTLQAILTVVGLVGVVIGFLYLFKVL